MIRVVLAEDQSMLRSALSALLALEGDLDVIGEAADGHDALRQVRAAEPDVLVSDIEMPGLTGLELAAQLVRDGSATRVLIITTFARHGYVQRARHLGVHGYLLKDAPSDQLADAIRAVAAGRRVYDDSGLPDPAQALEDPLTDRDRRILRQVEEGKTNKEIAAALNLSPGTVRNYLNEAASKLHASNRIEAFRKARENGWL
jgi:two-component system response regulator DesR